MKITSVIPSRRWKHTSGATASLYGAVPWTDDKDRLNWTVETIGWTWVCSNGTIGLGRVPAKTKEEALAVMERVNARCAA
jgi:hypothetical protein